MQVFVKVKAIASKKPLLNCIPIELDGGITNSNDLIEYIVIQNVNEYNSKQLDKPLFAYLTDEQLSAGEVIGKIGFDDRKNEAFQDEAKAVENALTCFNDGIFKLFIGEQEIGYNQTIKLNENDELTFIRLTMLVGRLW